MEQIFKIDIDGFEILAEIYSDYESQDFEITDLYDLDMNRLDTDIYDMIMDDNYDTIMELIEDKIQADKEWY